MLRALEPQTAAAVTFEDESLWRDVYLYPEQGWKSHRKNLSCPFLFLVGNARGKMLLFTVVGHLCPEMKSRREKIFIWTFQNNKKISSENGQRISSVVGCSELFV